MLFETDRSRWYSMLLAFIAFSTCFSLSQVDAQPADDQPITSRMVEGENNELIVVQEVLINASIEKVWNSYTTTKGWKSWIAPVAEVELKIGGIVKTNYRPDGKITDDDANTLHIINYCPHSMITLQAEVSKNWPMIMKQQEKQMFNVITFQKIEDEKTKITSYGTGYKNTPEFRKLVEFFIPANESTFRKLINYLENGVNAFAEK